MIGTELGSVAVGQAQREVDTNCYSSPALEPVRRYLKRPDLVFTATHARFGPTTPTRDTGLPLALRRLDRLPSCRMFSLLNDCHPRLGDVKIPAPDGSS
jgi:hypothetical protein